MRARSPTGRSSAASSGSDAAVSRPAIGIAAAIEEASWGAWTVLANVSPRSYSGAVRAAGGVALLLPPDDGAAEQPAELLDRIDGLLLAGGSDAAPGSNRSMSDKVFDFRVGSQNRPRSFAMPDSIRFFVVRHPVENVDFESWKDWSGAADDPPALCRRQS